MNSRIGTYLWWLSAAVRKRKPAEESTWGRLLDAIGTVLDNALDTVQVSRRRRFLLNPDQAATYGADYIDVDPVDPENPTSIEAYYLSDQRIADLDHHGRDRGLSRLLAETNSAFAWRIATHPHRARTFGTAAGIRYVIEALFGLRCAQIVEYYADRLGWVLLAAQDQPSYAENVLSHLFSTADQDLYPEYGQTRIYSEADLSTAYHFWVRVENPEGVTFDPVALIETINRTKPAHTRAVVTIAE